ncbi:MAG: helix-turn-helix domain-containing protein, partial [Eisenbergiella sp.]
GLRIAAARQMLQEEGSSVADVCQRTGYTNVSHFIKVFQKAEGITPARYRDEYKKGKETEKG